MERIGDINIISILKKYIIVAFTGIAFSYLSFIKSPILIFGIFLIVLLILFLAKYNGIFFANILLLVTILFLFSGDGYILKLANEINVYGLVNVWKFNIFEWWVAGLFFSFLLYRLKIAKDRQESLLFIGPLKPLLFFTLGGLILGVIGTVRNHSDLSFSQMIFYYEGILLYLVVLNIDLRKIKVKLFFYFIVTLVSLKALYHLILYFFGRGFHFGIVGNIVIGYADILENVVLISLIIFSALIFINNIKKPILITAVFFLLVNSLTILFSMRRVHIGIYLIGIMTILLFSKIKAKLKSIFLFGLLLSLITGVLILTANYVLLDKVVRRIDSINVFKYQNDRGGDITSSTGHISEVINGWRNVRENIFLGKGFESEIEKLQGWKYNFRMVHNELLFYWIRMGIFGMLMFFTMYLIPIFYCSKRIKNISYREYKWFYLAIMAFIIGKFFVSLTVVPPISLEVPKSFVYFILLGFVMNKTLIVTEDIKEMS